MDMNVGPADAMSLRCTNVAIAVGPMPIQCNIETAVQSGSSRHG